MSVDCHGYAAKVESHLRHIRKACAYQLLSGNRDSKLCHTSCFVALNDTTEFCSWWGGKRFLSTRDNCHSGSRVDNHHGKFSWICSLPSCGTGWVHNRSGEARAGSLTNCERSCIPHGCEGCGTLDTKSF